MRSSRGPRPGILAVALVLRLVVFALAQGAIALLLAGSGTHDAWDASAAWWPFSMTVGSIATFLFLRRRGRVEGFGYGRLLRPVHDEWPKDLLRAVVVVAIGGTLAVGGQIGLAFAIFGDAKAPNALLVQPLPLWAAVTALIVFPLSVALTELPLYLGYVQPRLVQRTGSAAAGILLPAVFLSLQHATAPLIFDPLFILWRGSMFIGFAVVLAFGTQRWPTILPYLVVAHFALDLQAAVSILLASAG